MNTKEQRWWLTLNCDKFIEPATFINVFKKQNGKKYPLTVHFPISSKQAGDFFSSVLNNGTSWWWVMSGYLYRMHVRLHVVGRGGFVLFAFALRSSARLGTPLTPGSTWWLLYRVGSVRGQSWSRHHHSSAHLSAVNTRTLHIRLDWVLLPLECQPQRQQKDRRLTTALNSYMLGH